MKDFRWAPQFPRLTSVHLPRFCRLKLSIFPKLPDSVGALLLGSWRVYEAPQKNIFEKNSSYFYGMKYFKIFFQRECYASIHTEMDISISSILKYLCFLFVFFFTKIHVYGKCLYFNRSYKLPSTTSDVIESPHLTEEYQKSKNMKHPLICLCLQSLLQKIFWNLRKQVFSLLST